MTEQQVNLEDEKLRAEVARLIAETGKFQREERHLWMTTLLAPFLAAAAVIGATAAIVKLFF